MQVQRLPLLLVELLPMTIELIIDLQRVHRSADYPGQGRGGPGSSGDKANFLIASAAEFLTPNNEALRNAFFHAAATVPSSGDLANVLIDALAYGHADPQVATLVVETSKAVASSGDAANILIDLATQRVLTRNNPRATLAAINRTLTMASSGDRANVLISIADANLLSTSEIRDAFAKAAMALPSDGDRANVLAAAAARQ